MRFFARLRALVPLVPLLISAAASNGQPALTAGSAHYEVYQGEKVVGAGDYTVQPTPTGYTITSHGKLNLTKFGYSFTNAQHLDGSLNLVSDQLSGTVNGSAVTLDINSDSTGRQFEIKISANGKQTQNTVDRHQHLVLLPDLDPAAYLLLTRVAMANPPTSWILIPKQDGILVPSTITLGSSVRGRLNGSEVHVQHTTISMNSENPVNIELFYTSDGQVLEADLDQQNFSVVLDGFKLIDHPKPAPPSAPAQPGTPQSPNTPQYQAPQHGYPQMQQQ